MMTLIHLKSINILNQRKKSTTGGRIVAFKMENGKLVNILVFLISILHFIFHLLDIHDF